MWNPPRIRPQLAGQPAAPVIDEPARVAARRRTWHTSRPLVEHADEMLTVEYSYSRGELQPVLQAIRDTLGCGAVPLDTPARLHEALATLIRSLSGVGDPTVRRSPAALLTPEYWHIRIDATDQRTITTLAEVVGRRAAR